VNAVEIAERARACVDGDGLARVTRERSSVLRFAANRPTQLTAVDDVTVEVAVGRGGHLGRAATNRIDGDGLADCARRATATAELASTAGPGAHPGLHVETAARVAGGAFDADTARLDPADGAAALATAFEVAREGELEAHGIWTAGDVEHAVADAENSRAERSTDAFFKAVCIEPRRRRSGYAARAARGLAGLGVRALCEEAAGKASVPGEAAELDAGRHPVVFEPAALGLLLDILALSAFNGLAHAEGRGALVGRLGEAVAAPAINLADSPRYRKTLPRSFDAEGTAKRPLRLIQDGVAMGVTHDRRSAALAGAESTGHAGAPGGDAYGPHATNLVLAGGGAADVAELCAPVERGVYVTRLWYANVIRPKETLVTAVTRDGTFLIEDGAVTRPLRDLRLTDSVLSILSSTEALARDQHLTSDGEFYGRRFAYGVVCPAMRANAVRFTGASG
jgi:PmbA protein